MEPATFGESDAMEVDANDDPMAFKPQHRRHAVKSGYPTFVRGRMLSNRNQQTGSSVLDSRLPISSQTPNSLKPVAHSRDSPELMTPAPNSLPNTRVFTAKRRMTAMFKGALERVADFTRKRHREGDDLDGQIFDSASSQYGSSRESAIPQPPKKTPRRGTFLPSSVLLAPPGLERCTVERSIASPNPNQPIFSNPQPSMIIPESRPVTPRPDDHKKRGHLRIGRVARSFVGKPAMPLNRHLSSLKDFFLPRPFDVPPEAANQSQVDHAMGDDNFPIQLPVQPANVLSDAIGVPTAQPTPMPMLVCSDPRSFYYDGEEPKTGRCESPEQIPEPYDPIFSCEGSNIGYFTGGNSGIQQLPIHGGYDYIH